MSLFVVDVESDGPCPGLYSMVSFGAVRVGMEEGNCHPYYYGKTRPISLDWIPAALAISKITRDQHETYNDPAIEMKSFADWIARHNKNGRPVFVSDNPAFDYQFINYYFHKYLGTNPFGHSARRIGDFYAGVKMRWNHQNEWKSLRRTRHTHHPVDDARGNVEALVAICEANLIDLPE